MIREANVAVTYGTVTFKPNTDLSISANEYTFKPTYSQDITYTSGYVEHVINKAVDSVTSTIAGVTYEKGVCTIPPNVSGNVQTGTITFIGGK